MGTLREIAYHYLGPFPVIFYLGIVGYAFLLATAGAMALPRLLKKRRPVKPIFYSCVCEVMSCRALRWLDTCLGTTGKLPGRRGDRHPHGLEHLPRHPLERGAQGVAPPPMADLHLPHLGQVP